MVSRERSQDNPAVGERRRTDSLRHQGRRLLAAPNQRRRDDDSRIGLLLGRSRHLTYGPIWIRDLWGTTYNDNLARVNFPDGLVRQLGANSIRTYAWWKWVPMTPADYSKWNTLDWSVSPRVRFGATTTPAGFAGWPAHDGGDQFLDLCWNHGVNPVYVVIGIALDPWLAFAGANPDPASLHDERMFIERTTKWLAQRYGNHPAVLGFAIGNETNLQSARGTDRYLDYWQYLNHLGAVAKHYAPDKLTMTAFADYPSGETPMLLKPLVAFKNSRRRASGRADDSGLRRSKRREPGARLLVGASTASLSRRHLRARRLGIQRVSQARD